MTLATEVRGRKISLFVRGRRVILRIAGQTEEGLYEKRGRDREKDKFDIGV